MAILKEFTIEDILPLERRRFIKKTVKQAIKRLTQQKKDNVETPEDDGDDEDVVVCMYLDR